MGGAKPLKMPGSSDRICRISMSSVPWGMGNPGEDIMPEPSTVRSSRNRSKIKALSVRVGLIGQVPQFRVAQDELLWGSHGKVRQQCSKLKGISHRLAF